MRHCSFAVPKNSKTSKVSSNKLSPQVFESKVKDRMIYNSTNLARASNNWRADYYRFSNLSYAQVLKKGKHMSDMVLDHTNQHKVSSQVFKNKTKTMVEKEKSTQSTQRQKYSHKTSM